MALGLIGRKVGMTQVFDPDGNLIPVTVLEVGPNPVIQVKRAAGKDGYNALKVGFGERKLKNISRPELGVFKASGVEPTREVVEFRVSDADLDNWKVGDALDTSLFAEGERVDVVGTSKGKGYAGVIKRHGFKGAKESSHGTHEYKRHGGSIGSSAWPARVIKGKKMAGQLGNARVTVQSLEIVQIFASDNLVLVKGAVPGSRQGIVRVQKAAKSRKAGAA